MNTILSPSEPVTEKTWVNGTDLRDGEGFYALAGQRLPSVTKVLDSQPPAYAWATWIDDEAIRLLMLARAGIKERIFTRVWTGASFEIAYEDHDPHALIMASHLKNHGARQGRRCADRGSICHALLSWRCGGVHLASEDVKYWVSDRCMEPASDGGPVTCSEDEAFPYVFALNEWLNETGAIIHQAERPVFTPGKYAGTFDAVIELEGSLYLADAKTSAASQRWHAEQLAALKYAKYTVDRETNLPILWRETSAHLTCLSILVQPDKVTPRALHKPMPWFRAFNAALRRFTIQQAAMPFTTLKGSVTAVQEAA